MERVKDLAIMHSSISSPEGRFNTYQRYEELVDRKFRERMMTLVSRYKWTEDAERKQWMKRRIAELNRRILECKKIWERYAPAENWDP